MIKKFWLWSGFVITDTLVSNLYVRYKKIDVFYLSFLRTDTDGMFVEYHEIPQGFGVRPSRRDWVLRPHPYTKQPFVYRIFSGIHTGGLDPLESASSFPWVTRGGQYRTEGNVDPLSPCPDTTYKCPARDPRSGRKESSRSIETPFNWLDGRAVTQDVLSLVPW